MMGICGRLAACIADPRDPARVVHRLEDILRARIFAIACGYEDADDLDALRADPVIVTAAGACAVRRAECQHPVLRSYARALRC
jgi:hypothetical protein